MKPTLDSIFKNSIKLFFFFCLAALLVHGSINNQDSDEGLFFMWFLTTGMLYVVYEAGKARNKLDKNDS